MAFNLPTLILEASFTDAPTSGSPTWTNITTYLRAWSSARGRNVNLPSGSSFDVGSAQVVLDNRDGRFDPSYTGGAYYPHIIPLVRMRLRATWNAVTYPVWDMFVDGWPSTYVANTDEFVTVGLHDALALLGDDNYFPGTDAPAELTSARISRVLSGVGLGSLPQSLATGKCHIVAYPQINVGALQHCQDCELSELGAFYSARDGTITFENRYHRDAATSQGTFGDGGGTELPYIALSPADDKTTLLNDSQVTDGLGTAFKYTDAASQAKYSQRSEQITLLTDTPNEGYDRAVWDVISQKDHSWRVPQIDVMPQRGSAGTQINSLYAQVLGREISDLITVKRRPPSGNVISELVFIERIEHVQTPGSWQTTFGLSPQRLTGVNNFVLDSATHGVLGNAQSLLAY